MSKNIGVEKPKLLDIPVDVCGGEARAAEFLCHIRVAALSVTVSNQKVSNTSVNTNPLNMHIPGNANFPLNTNIHSCQHKHTDIKLSAEN